MKLKKHLIKYFRLEELVSGRATIGGFAVKVSKKDRKKFRTLADFKNSHTELFNTYEVWLDINKQIHNLTQQIEQVHSGISYEKYVQLSNFCQRLRLIDDNGELTSSGIIASQINECECSPLFLEIFNQIIADPTLSGPEIAAIVSILMDPTKKERNEGLVLGSNLSSTDISVLRATGEYYNKGTVNCSDNVRTVIRNVHNYIENCKTLEAELEIYNSKDYWKTSLGYVEIAYNWSSGVSVGEILPDIYGAGEKLGTFVRNMLKVYNIMNDLKSISTDTQHLELIEVLDGVNENILRSIVNTFSLYLVE